MSTKSKCDRCRKTLYGLVPCPACRELMIAEAIEEDRAERADRPDNGLPVLDEAYGKTPTYEVAGRCLTCGARFIVRREKGVKPPLSVDCPHCGCTEFGWQDLHYPLAPAQPAPSGLAAVPVTADEFSEALDRIDVIWEHAAQSMTKEQEALYADGFYKPALDVLFRVSAALRTAPATGAVGPHRHRYGLVPVWKADRSAVESWWWCTDHEPWASIEDDPDAAAVIPSSDFSAALDDLLRQANVGGNLSAAKVRATLEPFRAAPAPAPDAERLREALLRYVAVDGSYGMFDAMALNEAREAVAKLITPQEILAEQDRIVAALASAGGGEAGE